MNSSNGNIYPRSSIAQNKKVCIQTLSRGAHLKSKLHSPPQADCNWKPINAFATHMGRKMGAAHSICTQVDPKHWDLHMGNWSVTSLNEKKEELLWEAKQYHLDIVGVSTTKSNGSDTVELNKNEAFLLRSRCNHVFSCRGRHSCKPLFGPLCH